MKRRPLLTTYLVLLLASHIVRWHEGRVARPLAGQHVVAVPMVDGAKAHKRKVEIAYIDLKPVDRPHAPVLLLIHGSPAHSVDERALAHALSTSYRVVEPDLPGFGRSTHALPDYSMRAHAEYLREFLDALGIERAHVVAYSMGGGPALLMYEKDPSRVESLTMLSSIGVQEHELLGDYTLNHGLHALQLAVLWAVSELVPHFGWLDDMMLSVPYARNFYDSDQRPLRGILSSFQPPMLIIHGRDDVLVPLAAAHEHHRIVPQSELVVLPGDHILVYRKAYEVARLIGSFVDRVEQGAALTRDQASPERLAQAAVPYNAAAQEPVVGLALVILMALVCLGTLVSEDFACVGAGLMVAHGSLTYGPAAAAAFVGIFVGDLLLFMAGRFIGRPVMRHRPFRWFFTEADIQDSTEWFAQRGPVVIFISRFVPGSRLPTYFTAGLLHLSFWSFFLYFLFAGVVWAPLLVWVASVLGEPVLDFLREYRTYTIAALVVAAVLLWFVIELVIPLFTFRGRRLLVSKWKRFTRWEFWPPWIFYPPLFVYLAWLALRHRGMTVFTASNPAIPAGGFLGESKAAILDGLRGAGDVVAAYTVVEGGLTPDEKVAAARAFIERRQLSWPVVAKPDVGQRGLGVAVLRSPAELAAYFATPRPATLMQEYVPGLEFGIFYYRHPSAERGRIFSITDKRFPVVTGDGKQNLERLILRDARAVCMARFYLHLHRDRLSWVPAEGERIQLVELGTHCRGAVFHDGTHLATPALEAEMDRISRTFEGFYFGRYDVRVPTVEDLQSGRGFRIIELNGVTSEATSIYEPGKSILRAYRTLMRQWRLAFEIGSANRAAGARPISVRRLLRLITGYKPAPEAGRV